MFTGIIECTGKIEKLVPSQGNLQIWVDSSITTELSVDQSVSHNGVCLTVEEIQGSCYRVTAIKETLEKTNLGDLKKMDVINLERCMPINGRLDGHIVQGHVDTAASICQIHDENGSHRFVFKISNGDRTLMVPKGSICINGVSLTLIEAEPDQFSVAVIPYTFEHTNFHALNIEDRVNIEYDIIGKYVTRLVSS